MGEIPVEIGIHIASLVSFQRDLASLCLVSPLWLETARPFLYKSLRINYGSTTLKNTMLMLSTNQRLKLTITSLHLDGNGVAPAAELTAEWNRNVDFHGMRNVTSLSMAGFQWSTTGGIQRNPIILQLLSQIRIPILNDFKISIYTVDNQPVRSLIQFLAEHPSITSCTVISNDRLYIDTESPKNILPNLASLSGNCFTILALYKLCAPIKNLTSLEFNMDTMTESQKKHNPILGRLEVVILKRINLRFPGFHRLFHYKTWERRVVFVTGILIYLARVAPSLEHISVLELDSLENEPGGVSFVSCSINYASYRIP